MGKQVAGAVALGLIASALSPVSACACSSSTCSGGAGNPRRRATGARESARILAEDEEQDPADVPSVSRRLARVVRWTPSWISLLSAARSEAGEEDVGWAVDGLRSGLGENGREAFTR